MYMKVLTTSTDPQTLSVIPRSYPASVTLKLRDDSKNTTASYTVAATNVQGYLTLSNAFSLVEGRFYDLVVYKVELGYVLANLTELDVIYKDKIFCTAQNLDQNTNTFYTPNESEYIEQSANNDFIIYD